MNIDNSLTSCAIPECIRKIAIPASVGFFFHTMFNVVDTYYAGLIGTTAQAALSLAFPVFFVVISVGSGLQVGSTALIGAALGSGDRQQAGEYARQGLIFGLLTTILLTLIGLFGARPLFGLLGAQDEYLEACLQYMLPIFGLSIFPILIYVFNAVLQAQGDTKSFRNMLMASSAANIGLDPWFIYGGFGLPAMGITGIAAATILCQAVGALYLGTKAYRTGVYSVPDSGGWFPKARPFADIARQSLPAGFNYVTIGLGIFIITYFVSRFGQTTVAAYGVATRVEQIVLMPTIGLNIATLTLTAQNLGANKLERVHEILRKALIYGAWMMLPGGIIVFLTAAPLMQAFTADPQVQAEGIHFLRIMAFLLYAYVVLFVSVAMLQGLKRPMFALWMGLWRQLIAPVTLFWMLTGVMDFGVAAIWWSIVAINSTAAVYSWAYARRVLTRLETSA
ncbi:MATE family efflux transporter [Desulfovibrio ferrophilus]|uniref:MATE efflux family protein n=1 Tax=Desulfovibrio ferrophilus TaxID=241368 RepID=A0A2Z6AUW3_9BACT|nr:MATE family efflux transporter [Desulfovibrio ferrophilus]BBD07008.1 MATE efflux family protein [Desulfovibrio ferrophilus]